MKNTMEVVDLLCDEGFITNYEQVRFMVRSRKFQTPEKFANAWMWSNKDVENIRKYLRHRKNINIKNVPAKIKRLEKQLETLRKIT